MLKPIMTDQYFSENTKKLYIIFPEGSDLSCSNFKVDDSEMGEWKKITEKAVAKPDGGSVNKLRGV